MREITLLSILCFGILFGCTGRVELEREKAILLETDLKFAETSRIEGAPEAFREYLAEDALQFPAGSPPVRGNETVYRLMKENMDPATLLDWKPEEAGVSKAGDLGYTWGTYTVYQVDSISSDRKAAAYGKYVNVWEKQPDGSWKVKIDIGNSSPVPERRE